MRSKLDLALGAALLIGATALVTARVVEAQDQGKEHAPAGMDPAMMAKMMEMATPGKEHKQLAKMAGSRTNHYKMRFDPNGPWQEVDGTCENKTILGGRFVMQDVAFTMEGMPMQGLQLIGFDKMSGEYNALWADSMSTWWVSCHGKADDKGVIDMRGTMKDIAGERPYRMVIRPKGDDETEIEMYDTIPPKGEVLVMSSTAKRKK